MPTRNVHLTEHFDRFIGEVIKFESEFESEFESMDDFDAYVGQIGREVSTEVAAGGFGIGLR